MNDAEKDAQRFDAMFDALGRRVFAYVRRQCGPDVAQDIVSETFLLAWEKRSHVPEDPLPWLLVVARNKIANLGRRSANQQRLAGTLARLERLAGPSAPADETVIERATVLAGLAALGDADREALLLVAWDGLTAADAAIVVGCTTRAFEMRLSRARARLERQIDDEPSPAQHPPLLPALPAFGKVQ